MYFWALSSSIGTGDGSGGETACARRNSPTSAHAKSCEGSPSLLGGTRRPANKAVTGTPASTGYLYGCMLRLLSGTDKQDQAIAEALSKMAGAL